MRPGMELPPWHYFLCTAVYLDFWVAPITLASATRCQAYCLRQGWERTGASKKGRDKTLHWQR